MQQNFQTEQKDFWHGNFGSEYTIRNSGGIKNNLAIFARILSRTQPINSIIEFGSNIGLNLKALDLLLPEAEQTAIEINPEAVKCLRQWGKPHVFDGSILEFMPKRQWDLVLTKGLLIHINPQELNSVYSKLFSSAARYICIAEYYNPKPVSIEYRGHKDRLFKRDFAGEMLDKFPSLNLVDYGFVYHRDQNFPQDDITWFLLEKTKLE
jgi:pseudaminic acid biosynthesis-associated methylase